MGWGKYYALGAGASGRNKILLMKAKRNRYNLSLWDVRKLPLYGRAMGSVQANSPCRPEATTKSPAFRRTSTMESSRAWIAFLIGSQPVFEPRTPLLLLLGVWLDSFYLHQDGIKRR